MPGPLSLTLRMFSSRATRIAGSMPASSAASRLLSISSLSAARSQIGRGQPMRLASSGSVANWRSREKLKACRRWGVGVSRWLSELETVAARASHRGARAFKARSPPPVVRARVAAAPRGPSGRTTRPIAADPRDQEPAFGSACRAVAYTWAARRLRDWRPRPGFRPRTRRPGLGTAAAASGICPLCRDGRRAGGNTARLR
jgi:hypothetical protein